MPSMDDMWEKYRLEREKNLAKEDNRGKKHHQKLKPYIVLQILQRETDHDHLMIADEIVDYLKDYDLDAERRSIYHDIEEINIMSVMMEQECSAEDAIKLLNGEDGEAYKLVVYDKSRKGFYVQQRKYDLLDIRLLAEAIYSNRFLTEGQSQRLIDTVCDFVSGHQAQDIRHNVFLTDRVRTNNTAVLRSISIINEAMSRRLDSKPHKPEKITFQYLKYSLDNPSKQVERKAGKKFCVSPFQFLINDGNYYLLAFDDDSKSIRTYRVDRMKNVERIGIPRDGEEDFREIDLKGYTQRVFSMYGGKRERVTIRFNAHLLDTVIERLGRNNVVYTKLDDHHFTATADIEISNQFYGWLCGFGAEAVIIEPLERAEKFKNYMNKIIAKY